MALQDRVLKVEDRGQDSFNDYALVTLAGTVQPTLHEVSEWCFARNYWGGRVEWANMIGDRIQIMVALHKD